MAQLSIGRYIFERLRQLGVKSVFGVPGDYELVLLDMIPEAGLNWRGNPNELIASYAADGYGRVNGVGAFVSTFGPGELSAYCGVAGQYTEFVPVAHIVGYPSTTAMNTHALMHHSLGTGEFGMYHEMTKHITVASTVLTNVSTAASEVDRVLNAMLYHSRPVYIGVPVDIGPHQISDYSLQTPLITSLPANDDIQEAKVTALIVDLLKSRKNPVIVFDGGAVRNKLLDESVALIKLLQIPYFTTAMSKGGLSESIDGKFGGVYGGGASSPGTRTAVESADLVLFLGNIPSDFNTGEFTEKIETENLIDFQRFSVSVIGVKYNITSKYLLQRLVKELKAAGPAVSSRSVTWQPYPDDNPKTPPKLTQDFLWPTLGKYFRPGDYVIAETGTSAYGIPLSSLMNVENVQMYNQTVFGSIGFATGAALGSFVAGKEDGSIKRGILITGEGSLQLTVQTFSDLLRHELNTTIFILNNDGYTIERLIHGLEAPYNTVPIWDYSKLCSTFGPSFKARYYRAETGNELVKILQDPEFNAAQCTQVVELILDKHDAPISIKLAGAAVEAFNKRAT